MSAEVKVSKNLQAIARGVEDVLAEVGGERMGFFLLVAPLGREQSGVSYIANVPREDAKRLMREFLAHQGPDVPLHTKN